MIKNISIAVLAIIVILAIIGYRGELKSNRQLRKEAKSYAKDTANLRTAIRQQQKNVAYLLDEVDASKKNIAKSEAEKLAYFKDNQKIKARYSDLYKKLQGDSSTTKEQFKQALASCDSLQTSQGETISLMELREVEFKNIISNQDSIIMSKDIIISNLNGIIAKGDTRMTDLANQLRAMKKKKIASNWERNLFIVGIITILILK